MCLVKTCERFMGIGQVITMPIFFASNAIYPMEIMPTWLRILSLANPLTDEVDGLRSLMIRGAVSTEPARRCAGNGAASARRFRCACRGR
jgi:ABC-2 type transport system permease protein